MIYLIILICIIEIVVIYKVRFVNKENKPKVNNLIYFEKFEYLLKYISYYEDLTYSIITNKHLIVNLVNTTTPSQDQLTVVKKEYIKILYGYFGVQILETIYLYFDNDEKFMKYLLSRLELKIDTDIIKKITQREINKGILNG